MKKTLLILTLIASAALAAAAPLSAQSATLRDITVARDGGKVVVSIKVDGKFEYESSTLSMPRRLIIDLTPVDKISAPTFLAVDAAGVASVRAGQFKPQTARLVFDLSEQNPAQSFGASDGLLKVSFWMEGEAAPAAVRETPRPAPAAPAPVREIPREEISKALDEPVSSDSRLGLFFRAGAGLSLFLKPEMAINREFTLYGETGLLAETYTLSSSMAFDAGLGSYLRLGRGRMKAGVGFTSWKLAPEGAFTVTLPHPFLTNSPRTVSFAETTALESSMMSFYGYALFPFVDGPSFSLFFGPLLGYASGKYLTLQDFDISEKSPFGSADVTLTNQTYYEDSVSDLLYGASLSMEVRLGGSFSLVLDTKMIYVNPKLANLGKRTNLFHLQPVLGIQYSF